MPEQQRPDTSGFEAGPDQNSSPAAALAAAAKAKRPPAKPLSEVAEVVPAGGGSTSGLHTTTVLSQDRIERYRRSRFNALLGITPTRLVQYLSDWEAGYLRNMALTMEQILRRDAVYKTVAPKRYADAARQTWQVQVLPGHEKDPEALAQKAALEHFYHNLRCKSAVDGNQTGGVALAIRQMIKFGVGLKYCVHEILWRQTPDGVTATLNHVPPWFFEARTGKLRFLMEDFAWDGVPMAVHDPTVNGGAMEVGSWMVSVGEGLMESGSILYIYGNYALRDWGDYSEQRGYPLMKAYTSAPENSDRWNALATALASFSPRNPIIMGPKETEDVDILSTAAQGAFAPQLLWEEMKKCKTALWRGGDLGTVSAGAGSGQGASLQGGETTNLQEDDCQWVSENFQAQLDPLVVRVVRGPNVPVLAYFSLGGSKKSNTALELQADTFLLGAGFPLSVSSVAERYNRPVPQPDEPLLTKPEPPSPFGGGGGFGGKGAPPFGGKGGADEEGNPQGAEEAEADATPDTDKEQGPAASDEEEDTLGRLRRPAFGNEGGDQPRDERGRWTYGYEGEAIKQPEAGKFIESLTERDSQNKEEIGNALTRSDLRTLVKTSDGKGITAAMAYKSTKDAIEIHHLGSTEKGSGSEAIKKIQKGLRGRRLIAKEVVPTAEGFYAKMGFVPTEGNDWEWRPHAANARPEVRPLVAQALARVGAAQSAALKPVADRLRKLLAAPDGELQAGLLRLRRDLPSMLREMNKQPKAAAAFESAIGTALAAGAAGAEKANEEFDEAKHPRGKDGRWVDSQGRWELTESDHPMGGKRWQLHDKKKLFTEWADFGDASATEKVRGQAVAEFDKRVGASAKHTDKVKAYEAEQKLAAELPKDAVLQQGAGYPPLYRRGGKWYTEQTGGLLDRKLFPKLDEALHESIVAGKGKQAANARPVPASEVALPGGTVVRSVDGEDPARLARSLAGTYPDGQAEVRELPNGRLLVAAPGSLWLVSRTALTHGGERANAEAFEAVRKQAEAEAPAPGDEAEADPDAEAREAMAEALGTAPDDPLVDAALGAGLDPADPELARKAQEALAAAQGEADGEEGDKDAPGAPEAASGQGSAEDAPPGAPGAPGAPEQPTAADAAPDKPFPKPPAGPPPELMDFQQFQRSGWAKPGALGLVVSNAGQLGAQHKAHYASAVDARKPVLKRVADYYGVQVPYGYQEQGDRYVWKGGGPPNRPVGTEAAANEGKPCGESFIGADKTCRVGEGMPNSQVRTWAEQRFGKESGKNFASWFGASKAVDENGEPLVLYHGTTRKNPKRLRESFEAGAGIFLTDNEDVASTFTFPREYGESVMEDEDGNEIEPGDVVQIYAKVENPLVIEGRDAQAVVDDTPLQVQTIRSAKQAGHDGIILRGVKEGIGERYKSDNYIVFSSTQVKATNNRGTWDNTDLLGNEPDPGFSGQSDKLGAAQSGRVGSVTEPFEHAYAPNPDPSPLSLAKQPASAPPAKARGPKPPELMDPDEFAASEHATAKALGVGANQPWHLRAAHRSYVEDAMGKLKPLSRAAVESFNAVGFKLAGGYKDAGDGMLVWSQGEENVPPKTWAQ